MKIEVFAPQFLEKKTVHEQFSNPAVVFYAPLRTQYEIDYVRAPKLEFTS